MYKWDPYKQYGVHQWIADSALRVLWEKDMGDSLKWLYNPDLGLELKNLGQGYGIPKWYLPNYCLNYYKGMTQNENYIRWTHVRRYLQFMYGSYHPDSNRGYNLPKIIREVKDTGATDIILNKPEARTIGAYIKIPSQKVIIPKEYKNPYLDPSQDIDFGDDKYEGAIKGILNAYNVAIDALSYEWKGDWKPKTETAAQAMGVIAHLIGDLAHPSHIYPHEGWGDAYVESKLDGLVEEWFDLSFSSKSGMYYKSSLGGPSWETFKPSKYNFGSGDLDCQSIVKKLIKLNYFGNGGRFTCLSQIRGGTLSTCVDSIDKANGRDPSWKDNTKEVLRVNIKRAVHYTAQIFKKICTSVKVDEVKTDMKNWPDYSITDIYVYNDLIKVDDQNRVDMRNFASKEEALKFCVDNDLYGIQEINDWSDLDNLDPNSQKVIKVPMDDGMKYYSVDVDAVILLPSGGVIAMGTFYASEEEYEKAKAAEEVRPKMVE